MSREVEPERVRFTVQDFVRLRPRADGYVHTRPLADHALLVPPFEVAPLALPGLVVGDEAVWPAGVDGAVA